MSKKGIPKTENSFRDMFAPYSPERQGDLLRYLKSRDDNSVDNFFSGPEYFQKIVELDLVSPGYTVVRVNQSPAPDATYFVNDKFMLESLGQGEYNMSAMSAKTGVYKPEKVLKNKLWSISGLIFTK